MQTLCNAIDLFEKGMPPIAGGSLDQSATFVEAAAELNRAENAIKAEWKWRANQ